MGAYNVVNRPALASGQPEDISQVLANLDAIATVLNGGIDDTNVAAAAGILASKLAGYPNDQSRFLRGDGTWGGAYAQYVPALSSSGGGGAVGNGIVAARYNQIGKLVHYTGRLILGTTTSFGAGSLWLPLPVPFANNAVLLVGHGYAFDQSASTISSVVAIAVGANVVRFTGTATFNGVGNDVSGTVPFPFAWAVNDELNWNIVYEAA
jgi:hypothetical protein